VATAFCPIRAKAIGNPMNAEFGIEIPSENVCLTGHRPVSFAL